MATWWETNIGEDIDEKVDEAVGAALKYFVEEEGWLTTTLDKPEPHITFYTAECSIECSRPLADVLEHDLSDYGGRGNSSAEAKLCVLLLDAIAEWKKQYPQGVPKDDDELNERSNASGGSQGTGSSPRHTEQPH